MGIIILLAAIVVIAAIIFYCGCLYGHEQGRSAAMEEYFECRNNI
jgi:hypothetical protein